jgi:hypothetical protein
MVSTQHIHRFEVCAFSGGGLPEDKTEHFCQKNNDDTFFTPAGLLVLNFQPKGTNFNQDYFIDAVLRELYNEKTRIAMRKDAPSFSVHKGNLMGPNGAKTTEKLAKKHIARVPHYFIRQTSVRATFGYLGF